jgi:MFS family permease
MDFSQLNRRRLAKLTFAPNENCSGFAFGGLLDTGMTMLVKERYGLSSRGAGLIFIAAVVPSFISSPLAGNFADKYGAKWPIVCSLVIGTPFFGLLSMNGSLAALIAWIAFTGTPLSIQISIII